MSLRQNRKDDIVFAYLNKEISRKQAAAQLVDLKYEEWEIDLFLDDERIGPDGEYHD